MADSSPPVSPELYPDIAPATPPEDTVEGHAVEALVIQRGRSGTLIPSGFITAEDYSSVWDTRKRFDVIEEMRRGDPTVNASLEAINLPIIAADWDIPPLSDDPVDIEIAAFCKHNLFERVSFYSFLTQALTYLPFGYATFEKVFEVIEWNGKSYLGLKKLSFMKQWTVLKWQTPAGNLGITQMLKSGPSNVPIPWWKLVVFTNKREGDNYMGISVLRTAHKPWDIKHKLELIEAIAAEKQGLGIVYLTIPAGASEQDKMKAREVARNMRANEEAYAEMPEGFSIDFLDMKGHQVFDINPVIARHNRSIFMNVLAQFMDLGSGGSHGNTGGARALSQDQSGMFHLSLEGHAKNIAETIYSAVLTDLVKLNYPGKAVPKIVFGKFGDDNLQILSNAINVLMLAGALHPDPSFEEWLRKILKAPDLPDTLRAKLEVKMLDVDTTTESPTNDNRGENLNDPLEKNTPPKGSPPDDTKQTSTTDKAGAPEKQPVQAIEALEAVRAFRSYLDEKLAQHGTL